MKLSLAWVFDHIDADWKKVDVQQLVQRFNQMVAEIEGYHKVHIDLEPITMVEVTGIHADSIVCFSKEWEQEYLLSPRKGVIIGQYYLIKKNDSGVVWANAQDLGSGKDMLMPAMAGNLQASWKNNFETHDYILEVDNKSITHRPDMWGHRGFAREVAAILNVPFKSLNQFLADKKMTQIDALAIAATASNPFAISIQAPQACKRIAGMYLNNIAPSSSLLWMAHRLARVDARAIDAVVDMTNYVMLEMGQPMHAFDAPSFTDKRLVVRMAKNKEKLTLLDGETVELTDQDLVLSDGTNPLGLAGVMGGQSSGMTSTTTSMLVEAACFDAATIRRTAARYKKRSEASARFEKSLDPNQNTIAIQRFLKLMRDAKIAATESDEIFSLGVQALKTEIIVSHEMIEKRLGVTLAPEFVIKTLTALDFGVQVDNAVYTVTVPTFRATKDIKIKEDIIEEIGRFYGYTTLETCLPALQLAPSLDLGWVYQQRKIKQTLAFACSMRELYTYAFFDEEFLATIKWQPSHTLEVQSPVSENWRRLVTTLVPNLLKSVASNGAEHDQLRFFELARIWETNNGTMNERKSLAGIFFDKKSVNFYDAKAELQKLFDMLKLKIEWVKVDNPDAPWYAPHQTADLLHNDSKTGTAGLLHPTFLSSVIPGYAFIFELDADFLLNYKSADIHFIAASKYPEMVRDISILASTEMTADSVADVISQVDKKISSVSLLDFFQKEEWPDKRAMTMRFVISDHERTMTKEEADVIWDKVAATLKGVGATIR